MGDQIAERAIVAEMERDRQRKKRKIEREREEAAG